ncbi:hypothetical protein LOK49_LG09G02558 [Camellia lanceoleosa]|uniref:Uncharacterized protein n=1 Tax=Camellia lanceoleosa TaxID=1840588 RepID=A0ACC0GJT8_9ERIC|nr:hypothetical protein LOK49_LG09G02558 [Camellia lanceoleosa]
MLRIYHDTLTAHMKTAIKIAIADILHILLTQPLESNYAPGERMVDANGGSSLASKLRSFSSKSFVQLLEAIFSIVRVIGLNNVPIAGDEFEVVSSLDVAREKPRRSVMSF